MTKAAAAHVDMAARLLADCRRGDASIGDAAAELHAALYRLLTPLIGGAGFQAVFARSVKLTKAELPGLEAFVVEVAAELDTAQRPKQLRAWLDPLEPPQASDAAAALYGTLFALLDVLVGERLVRQVLRRAFPAIDHGTKETK